MDSHAIWLLFGVSLLTPIFDKLLIATKYQWNNLTASTINNPNQTT